MTFRVLSRRVTLAFAIFIATAISLLGPTPTADAYVVSSFSGRVGALAWGQASSSPGRIVSLPGYRFEMPQLLVYRNGEVAAFQQEIAIVYVVQRWSGRSWDSVGYERMELWSGFDASSPAVGGTTVVPSLVRRTGHFRAKIFVLWGGAAVPNGWSGYVGGTKVLIPNANNDLRCAHARCQNWGTAHGSVYVSG